MESVMHKIFNGKTDGIVHSEFIKFSKGTFDNRYLIEAKKQKEAHSIKTSAEFSNFFVSKLLEGAKSDVDVKGVIVCTFDISKDAEFEIEDVKKYMGIQQLMINTRISPQKILSLMKKYPRVHFGLSFKTESSELKIKPKAPKSGKPSSKGDEPPKADFCTLKTTDLQLVNDLLFDVKDAKEVKIQHTIVVEEIILPKGVSNPVELREKSVRKGKIIRNVMLEGSSKKSEMKFTA